MYSLGFVNKMVEKGCRQTGTEVVWPSGRDCDTRPVFLSDDEN